MSWPGNIYQKIVIINYTVAFELHKTPLERWINCNALRLNRSLERHAADLQISTLAIITYYHIKTRDYNTRLR